MIFGLNSSANSMILDDSHESHRNGHPLAAGYCIQEHKEIECH